MNDKLIFEIQIEIDNRAVSFLKGPAGESIMIPFTGKVKGELLNGKVLPGGVDTQRVNQNGVRHMSARYMIDCVDKDGDPCRVFIENNGWFESQSTPFKTIPTFMTDSKKLAPYLHCNNFRGEGHTENGSVVIKFFEIAD
ncbi:MAG: DUF3237 domain-containing protein [Clostridiales bacterium]|nr:DUF3237 domain-containing protein [Clostridiales bacterium]